jgi:hypothetical protein
MENMSCSQGGFQKAPQRDIDVVWTDFIDRCSNRSLHAIYDGVPSEKANRILKLYDNDSIMDWIASLKELPISCKLDVLRFPIMGGPVGSIVYAYKVPKLGRKFYIALFERLKNNQTQMVLKSLKLDGETGA